MERESAYADVRLVKFDVTGFRSCRKTAFEPNPGLSALIGVNGAGKTNVLQALRLLDARRARQNRRVAEDISRARKTVIVAWFRVRGKSIGLKLDFSLSSVGRRDEVVSVEETWNFRSITGARAWKAIPPPAFFHEGARALKYSDQLMLFSDDGKYYYSPSSLKSAKKIDTDVLDNKAVIQSVLAIEKFRAGISYYSASQFTDPTRCPSSFEVDEDKRLTDPNPVAGAIHLRFIHDLYRLRVENPDRYLQYTAFIARNQLGLISRLTWKEVELSSNTAEIKSGSVSRVKKTKTLVIPKVQIGSAYITFNQLSEGTFKTLALIFYIMTDSSRFLMIEEPEVCVHHGLLSRLVATLKAYARTKQIIISTHSDLLVDDLAPKNIFVVEMRQTGTRVQMLDESLGKGGKAALHTYLAESGTLGEYWRSGGLS